MRQANRLGVLKRALQKHQLSLPPESRRILLVAIKHQEYLLKICRERHL